MTLDPSTTLAWHHLGVVPYKQAWEWQKTLRQRRIEGVIDDQLLLLEHPATITLGRLRGEESLRHSVEQLAAQEVTVIRSDRGGDATLHAPGQMVGYMIVNMTALGFTLPRFVEALAGVFVTYLQGFGVEAAYDPDFPGVWVGDEKIVAFGFHLQKGVTMHGFAMNLHTDLSLFDLIVPCGLHQKGVTSLAKLSQGETPTVAEASQAIAEGIAQVLGLQATKREKLPL